MKLLVILSVLCFMHYGHGDGDEVMKDSFNVNPGGQTEVFEKQWRKYKCTFIYKAQGGTNEKWQFIFEMLDDGGFLKCTVMRGQTSYLIFENFTMSLTGPRLELENYDAVSYLDTPLQRSECKMDKKKNTVSSVDGEFQKKLERVTIMGRVAKKKRKTEL